MSSTSPILMTGSEAQRGAYILRLAIARPLCVAFGRFRAGEALPVPAGIYVYVGSAMGSKGPASLAPRLLRHASRSPGQVPHPIRAQMLREFRRCGLGSPRLRPPAGKSPFWHVDYLLDLPQVALAGVIVVRCRRRLEAALADMLLADPHTATLADGIGASDAPGQTHLLRADPSEGWWRALYRQVQRLIASEDC